MQYNMLIYTYEVYLRCGVFTTNIDSPSRYATAIISKRRLPLSQFRRFTCKTAGRDESAAEASAGGGKTKIIIIKKKKK